MHRFPKASISFFRYPWLAFDRSARLLFFNIKARITGQLLLISYQFETAYFCQNNNGCQFSYPRNTADNLYFFFEFRILINNMIYIFFISFSWLLRNLIRSFKRSKLLSCGSASWLSACNWFFTAERSETTWSRSLVSCCVIYSHLFITLSYQFNFYPSTELTL